MAFDQLVIRVSRPVYERLTGIKQAMQDGEDRQVTYSETLGRMADLWDRAVAAAAELEET